MFRSFSIVGDFTQKLVGVAGTTKKFLFPDLLKNSTIETSDAGLNYVHRPE